MIWQKIYRLFFFRQFEQSLAGDSDCYRIGTVRISGSKSKMLVLEKFRASIALYKKYAQNQTLDRIRRKKSTIRMKVAKYRLVAQLGGRVVRKAMQKSQLQAKNPSWQKGCEKQQKYGLVAQLGAHIIQATPKGTLKFGKFEILKFKWKFGNQH